MKTRFPTAVLWTLYVLSRFPILDKLEVSARPSDRKDGDKTMDFDESGQAQCDADELTWRSGDSLATGAELYGLTRANGDGYASGQRRQNEPPRRAEPEPRPRLGGRAHLPAGRPVRAR